MADPVGPIRSEAGPPDDVAASDAPVPRAAPLGRPVELSHLPSADVEDALRQFSNPELLARGRVNLISVEAVQAAFGLAWDLRKGQVCSFAERLLDRKLHGSGASLRISDTDFLVMQPDLGRLAGQAASLGYLREILSHFLGDGAVAASGVLQVTRIVDGQVEAARVESRNLETADPGCPETREADDPSRAAASRIAQAAGAPEFNPEAGIDGAVNAWTPFMSNDGRRLRVCSTLEPVYELKGFSRIGFRMIRRVIEIRTGEELTPHQVSLLSTADQLKVDMATILRGIERLRADGLAEQQLSLIVPISFTSLSTQRGRAELIAPLKEASGLVKLGVICEICGIEGVPLKALVSATSLVKPFSLLVVARLGLPAPHTINPLREAGLQAISFECPAGLEEAQFLGWSSAAIRASKAVARSVLVYGATSTARAGALASLGASHVSMAAA